MDELSPRARALLDRAQSDFSPSVKEAERLHARLFDAPPPDDPDDGGEGTPSAGGNPSPAGAAGHFGLYLALAALVIAWLAWPGPERAESVADATPATEPLTTPTRIPPAPPPPAPPPPARIVDPVKAPALPDDARPPADPTLSRVEEAPIARTSRRARPAAAPAQIPDEPAPPEPTDDLAAELALIGEARRALNGERWSTLRALVAEHGRRFPAGVLRDEAEVLDLIARCGTERSDALPETLRDAVHAYLDTPGRVFAKRLRQACLE